MYEVAVIGAGTIGGGVARIAALHGDTVHLVDNSREALDRCWTEIAQQLAGPRDDPAPADRDAVLARIILGTDFCGCDQVTLAVEAAANDLSVKQEVFRLLDQAVPEFAVLATTTCSMAITRVADDVKDPSRVVGMHFIDPSSTGRLVEIIAARQSADSSIEVVLKAARRWGRIPVLVRDVPGFIVNRIGRGFHTEAIRLLGEGIAGVDEIDAIVRTLGDFKFGPFEEMDRIGLDSDLALTAGIWERLDRNPRFAVHPIQEMLVRREFLGRKTGRGFYSYKYEPRLPAHPVDRRSFELSPLLADAMLSFSERAGVSAASTTERYVFSRILAAIINEAGYVYSENTANRRDIDLAMAAGAGYPRGPLAWADDIGHRTVRGFLKAMNAAVSDDRYRPAPFFQDAE